MQFRRSVNVGSPCICSDHAERSVERRALAAQVSKNGPELAFWEEHLAMKIEGVKADILRIVYNHISETDWMREYSFTVDLSERDYKGTAMLKYSLTVVLECKPSLPQIDELVQKLNRSREFFEFLKWMRQAFKQQSLK